MATDPDRFKSLVEESLRRQAAAINTLSERGMYFFDYGNAFLLEASRAGAEVMAANMGLISAILLTFRTFLVRCVLITGLVHFGGYVLLEIPRTWLQRIQLLARSFRKDSEDVTTGNSAADGG